MAAQNITGKTVHETEYLKVYQVSNDGGKFNKISKNSIFLKRIYPPNLCTPSQVHTQQVLTELVHG